MGRIAPLRLKKKKVVAYREGKCFFCGIDSFVSGVETNQGIVFLCSECIQVAASNAKTMARIRQELASRNSKKKKGKGQKSRKKKRRTIIYSSGFESSRAKH